MHTHPDFPNFYVTFYCCCCSILVLFILFYLGLLEGRFFQLEKENQGKYLNEEKRAFFNLFFLPRTHFKLAKYFFMNILQLVVCDKLSYVILLVIVAVVTTVGFFFLFSFFRSIIFFPHILFCILFSLLE